MPKLPTDPAFDSTAALLRDGYLFIGNRCRRFGADGFRTRLLGQSTLCIRGPEAARLIYDSARFRREDAVPLRVQRTLLGRGGVQQLDDAHHRQRKAMFMSLMTPADLAGLVALVAEEWDGSIGRWERAGRVELLPEMRRLFCRVACRWTGIPLPEDETSERARDLGAMVDGFAAVGPRYWRARRGRIRTERWIGEVVARARRGDSGSGTGSALDVVIRHQEPDGRPLSIETAAVELINLLRPIVAISTYVTFAALALHEHADWRLRLRQSDFETEGFVHEVRRYYPFTPFIGARARADFEWRGQRFREGTLALLDVYGTLRDERFWDRPEQFRPERFRGRRGTPFDFIPQGGGDYLAGHRCAGEWVTIEAMKVAVTGLVRWMTYEVPPQDLSVPLSRIPTLPRSGFVISRVRRPVSVTVSA
jgi:fatty-acid peroxygenase